MAAGGLFLSWIALLTVSASLLTEASAREGRSYVNSWAVEVPGGLTVAQQVAKRHGFNVVEQVRMDIFVKLE